MGGAALWAWGVSAAERGRARGVGTTREPGTAPGLDSGGGEVSVQASGLSFGSLADGSSTQRSTSRGRSG
ncbi:hypothetical protein [Pseudenhygromyxa sp. WMMC2535]|uniref:hypothetical protein n=1 Tax=Pseudenhygromyxa sp. WMMC2535 TaxID=2712867 RepID=UPI0020D14834|nr:hypothetical protein [Pseudenhygromyxa sp. WMMC2535]